MAFTFCSLLLLVSLIKSVPIDPNGYITFCPCMGRFGNQVEQYLGVLSFANSINRTLVLPPFIEYRIGHHEAEMVEFDQLFRVDVVRKYHRVMTMKHFMHYLAPTLWPKHERKVLCWGPRRSIYNKSLPDGCHPKEGNPFGPFWEHSAIDFVGDLYYGDVTGGFNVADEAIRREWQERYPVDEYPVLAFSSAPSSFPAKVNDRPLQRYLQWTSQISSRAKAFIHEHLQSPFLAIHLRNDVDWENVCKHIDEKAGTQLFGSAQCIGDRGERGILTKEMCAPSLNTILKDVEFHVRRHKLRSVFVSSDREHYIMELNERLAKYNVTAYRSVPDNQYLSLAVMGMADQFLGNCVSTFSSFVVRYRLYNDNGSLPISFFVFDPGNWQDKTKTEL